MKHLHSEIEKGFDPRVVAAIEKRYLELEQVVSRSESTRSPFPTVASQNRSVAPSAGFAEVPNAAEVRATSFLASIVSARQEAQLLFELAQTLGNSLSLRETLSVVAVRLKEMIPHDLIVFYVCRWREDKPPLRARCGLRTLPRAGYADWTGNFWLGCPAPEADHQWRSRRGIEAPGRPLAHFGLAFHPFHPASRPRWSRRRSYPLQKRETGIYKRPPAHVARRQFQTRLVCRKLPAI